MAGAAGLSSTAIDRLSSLWARALEAVTQGLAEDVAVGGGRGRAGRGGRREGIRSGARQNRTLPRGPVPQPRIVDPRRAPCGHSGLLSFASFRLPFPAPVSFLWGAKIFLGKLTRTLWNLEGAPEGSMGLQSKEVVTGGFGLQRRTGSPFGSSAPFRNPLAPHSAHSRLSEAEPDGVSPKYSLSIPRKDPSAPHFRCLRHPVHPAMDRDLERAAYRGEGGGEAGASATSGRLPKSLGSPAEWKDSSSRCTRLPIQGGGRGDK